MTADERIEALLNRAGQTISDIPTEHSREQRIALMHDVQKELDLGKMAPECWDYEEYALRRVEIIDRMETALDNALRELEDLRLHRAIEVSELRPFPQGADRDSVAARLSFPEGKDTYESNG